jgi:hypothetical protein
MSNIRKLLRVSVSYTGNEIKYSLPEPFESNDVKYLGGDTLIFHTGLRTFDMIFFNSHEADGFRLGLQLANSMYTKICAK